MTGACTGRSRRCLRRRRSARAHGPGCRPARCAARDRRGTRPAGARRRRCGQGCRRSGGRRRRGACRSTPGPCRRRSTSPATMRLPARPRPNAHAFLVRPDDHLEGMAVATPAAAIQRVSDVDGGERCRGRRRSCRRSAPSRCASRRGSAAADELRRPRDVAKMLPAGSMRGSRPAPRIRSIT